MPQKCENVLPVNFDKFECTTPAGLAAATVYLHSFLNIKRQTIKYGTL
jgi:hypothetical protein